MTLIRVTNKGYVNNSAVSWCISGEQLFLLGMVIFQRKDWFSLASLSSSMKNNVTSQPRAFLIITAQHIVAQLTWIKLFLILGFFFFFFFRSGHTYNLCLLTERSHFLPPTPLACLGAPVVPLLSYARDWEKQSLPEPITK